MQVDMDADETLAALWATCGLWSERAALFQQLADTGFVDGSRSHSDNAAASIDGASLAVSGYVRERTRNIARMLRSLHKQMFNTDPGRLHLDATVFYPLMRAALEDAATVSWLLAPEERSERLTRVMRALFTDSLYFVENNRLVAAAAAGVGAISADDGESLRTHMESERTATRAHFEALARGLGLNVAEATRKLSTSAPVSVVYGNTGVEFTTWKFLSDLSHFSYMMLRHLATSRIPGSTVRLEHASFLQFAQTLAHVSDDAARHVARAAAAN